jgi:hypoxanthine-guanine phosphoribosyltransferase
MLVLERLGDGGHDLDAASWYAVRGEPGCPAERYVLSTPFTRDICNKPELLGVAYTEALCRAMAQGLAAAPFAPRLRAQPEEKVCVLNLLRGGLNFGLRRALHLAFGFNRHGSAFMSSQRYVEDGQWGVAEDSYRKLDIPQDAVLVVGDVVATGVTLENGLEVLRRHMVEIGASAQAMVFFTIGGPRAEEVLGRVHERFAETFPGYERTCVVYLEGRFVLADEHSPLQVKELGTDLLRHGALLAPEFELSQLEALGHPLERCSIYDAGSRAFAIDAYIHDVLDYWQQLSALAQRGLSLRELLLERWPTLAPAGRDEVLAAASERWQGVDPSLLQQLLTARQAFWAELVGPLGSRPSALSALCERRIHTLQLAAGQVEGNEE